MNRRDAVSAGQAAWNLLKPMKTGSCDNSNQFAAVFEEAQSKMENVVKKKPKTMLDFFSKVGIISCMH